MDERVCYNNVPPTGESIMDERVCYNNVPPTGESIMGNRVCYNNVPFIRVKQTHPQPFSWEEKGAEVNIINRFALQGQPPS